MKVNLCDVLLIVLALLFLGSWAAMLHTATFCQGIECDNY